MIGELIIAICCNGRPSVYSDVRLSWSRPADVELDVARLSYECLIARIPRAASARVGKTTALLAPCRQKSWRTDGYRAAAEWRSVVRLHAQNSIAECISAVSEQQTALRGRRNGSLKSKTQL